MSKAKKALETAIVRCMNVLLLGMLTRGCSMLQITPEDIARPGDRDLSFQIKLVLATNLDPPIQAMGRLCQRRIRIALGHSVGCAQ